MKERIYPWSYLIRYMLVIITMIAFRSIYQKCPYHIDVNISVATRKDISSRRRLDAVTFLVVVE